VVEPAAQSNSMGSAAPGPTAGTTLDTDAVPPRSGRLRTRVRSMVINPYFLALLAFLALGALALRNGGLGGAGDLPEGTNALNASLTFSFLRHQPSGLWLYPFTDWGQADPGFTGPTALTPLIFALPPTVLVRGIEFAGFAGAGLSMMYAVRRLGGTPLGGFVAGVYYSTVVQTPQFFEGHVPAMISLALGPVFFVGLWQLLWAPTPRLAIGVALVLYLLVSIGDLGILYFYVFFAVPLAVYVLMRRNARRLYGLRELAAVAAGILLLVVLSLSWLYPYAEGIRPEYTTNVTTTIIPFSQTFCENLGYALTGYVQDNSFIHVTYNQPFYSLDGLTFLPLFFLVPVATILYGVLGRRLDRIALLVSAALAIVFATGHLYPALAPFNGWFYDHVPFFDSIPALYRWPVYSVLAFSILFGLLISAVDRDATTGFVATRALLARITPRRPAETSGPAPAAHSRARWLRTPHRRWFVAVCVSGVVLVVTLQNFALVDEPPGVFNYPIQYQAAFSFLEGHPVTGSILVEPFGGIYERSPWEGVGASSGLMIPYYTGDDAVIFEAGTPYSLALDDFLGGGLVDGASRNMTSFLGLTNIQYILANSYSPWTRISSFPYRSDLAYNALANQSGLGPAQVLSSTQLLYPVANGSGNVSFDPDYLVYLGGDELLYDILDAPWYGAGTALVNGSTVGGELAPLVEHAQGLVVTPAALAGVAPTILTDARAAAVPILVVEPPDEFTLRAAVLQSDPWNVTGGMDIRAVNGTANASAAYDLSQLVAAGYGPVTVSAELAAPPGSEVGFSLDGVSGAHATSNSSITAEAPVNYSAAGFARVNATNATEGYSGNVTTVSSGGTTYLDWTPLAQDRSPQALDLALSNLTGWNGFQVTVRGNAQIPLLWKLARNQTTALIPGYPTIVPTSPNDTVYRFILPPGDNGMPRSLLTGISNLTGVSLVLNSTGAVPQVDLSNLTFLQVVSGPLSSVFLGSAPEGALNVTMTLPPGARLGRLTVTTGPLPRLAPDAAVRDFAPQPSSGSATYSGPAFGWGILTFAQTYSPAWSITGPGTSVHAVVDVGLNGWLVDGKASGAWQIDYSAITLEHTALVAEGIGLVGIGALAVAIVVRRQRRSKGGG
jgi:hypothetical protein